MWGELLPSNRDGPASAGRHQIKEVNMLKSLLAAALLASAAAPVLAAPAPTTPGTVDGPLCRSRFGAGGRPRHSGPARAPGGRGFVPRRPARAACAMDGGGPLRQGDAGPGRPAGCGCGDARQRRCQRPPRGALTERGAAARSPPPLHTFHSRLTKLSSTRLRPAFSKSISSLLPSISATVAVAELRVEHALAQRDVAAARDCRS